MLKKAIVVFSAVVAIIALLVGIFGISVIAYANENIDYEFDKRKNLSGIKTVNISPIFGRS